MLKSFGTVAGVSLALLAVHTAQAQDVKTVVTKTNAVYRNMKTLKVSLETSMTVDKQSKGGVKTDGQFIPGQKASIRVVPQGKSAPADSQGALVVDDGKTSYMIDLKTSKYFKQPHNPNLLPIMGLRYGLPFGGIDPKANYFKLLAPSASNGIPCFVLQLSPPAKNVTTNILIYIDKATYHVKQAQVTQSDGKHTFSAQTLVKSEAINTLIPDSQFTLPKGVQEVPAPTPSQQQPPQQQPPLQQPPKGK